MPSRKDVFERDRMRVQEVLDGLGEPTTCREIAKLCELDSRRVGNLLKRMIKGGSVEVAGEKKERNACGKQIFLATYKSTGNPFAEPSKPSQSSDEDDKEPDGKVHEIPLGPNHRRIKFGKQYRSGSGQTVRRPFCMEDIRFSSPLVPS